MNKITLTGRLVRDAEIKSYPNTQIATFTLASNKKIKDKEEVLFIDCKAFARLAEIVDEFTEKGDKILIVGRLVLEKWQDKEGNEKSKYVIAVEELELLSNKKGSDESEPKKEQRSVKELTKSYKTIDVNSIVETDEIPF